jgi:glucan phosphoethanolaminetransferase (alkaline phosphatase superfamily)
MFSSDKQARRCKALEDGFNVPLGSSIKIDNYNALHDPNMRHYFENKGLQTLLYSTGQIDKHGRVIDPHKSKSKINVLEREFKSAQQTEGRRQQEEMDMRVRKRSFREIQ